MTLLNRHLKLNFPGLIGIWLGLGMLLTSTLAMGHGGNGYVVKLHFKDFKKGLSTVQSMGLDLAGINIKEKLVEIITDDLDQIELLRKNGLEFEMTSNFGRMEPTVDSEFKSPEEIDVIFAKFAKDFPEITTLESVGKSIEGRDIWALKISDNPTEEEADEPAVLFNAMHHAREIITPEVIIDIAEQLLNGYDDDEEVQKWVNRNQIYLVPQVNPDGSNKVWNGNKMWRKNARGGFGVDLNRNYPYQWGACSGSSGFKWSQTYRGPEAASEPETKTMMSLVGRVLPVFDISYHSYSELVIYPYGCEDEFPENKELVVGVAETLASKLVTDDGSGTYTPGTGWELLYSVDGDDASWMYQDYRTIAFVVEVNSTSTGFHPPWSMRDETVEKQRPGWKYLLDRLETSSIRGYLDAAEIGEKVTDARVTVESLGDNEFKDTFLVKADGSFHAVVDPGMYEVTIKVPGQDDVVKEITVGGDRVELQL